MAKRKKKPYQPSFDETWLDDVRPVKDLPPIRFSIFGQPDHWDFTPYVEASWVFVETHKRCNPVGRLQRTMDLLADRPDTWYGFLWVDTESFRRFSGRYINGRGLVYNKILYPLCTAHNRCKNCKVALLGHRGKHCMYETTTFEPTGLPVYNVRTGKRLTLEELWALSSSGT